MSTVAELTKVIRSRARRSGTQLPALSKMKKAELQTFADHLRAELLIKGIEEEAEYRDFKWRQECHREEKKYGQVVSALLRTHNFSLEDLEQWSWSKLTIEDHPATEYISVSCRASVWTKYVDASIILNDKTYDVKNVCVWSETNGI